MVLKRSSIQPCRVLSSAPLLNSCNNTKSKSYNLHFSLPRLLTSSFSGQCSPLGLSSRARNFDSLVSIASTFRLQPSVHGLSLSFLFTFTVVCESQSEAHAPGEVRGVRLNCLGAAMCYMLLWRSPIVIVSSECLRRVCCYCVVLRKT
jgi:hypothetical protein